MRLVAGHITRHENGRDFEPTDEALVFIEGADADEEGNASIHIKCAQAKSIAQEIITAFNKRR